MKTLLACLLCVLSIVAVAVAQDRPVTAAPTAAPATAPAPRQDPTVPAIRYDAKTGQPTTRFANMHEQFLARAKEGNVDLRFLGDSITQGWGAKGKDVWKQHYAKYNVANFGIGGDGTQHVCGARKGEMETISRGHVLMIHEKPAGPRWSVSRGVTKVGKPHKARRAPKSSARRVPRGAHAETGGAREKSTAQRDISNSRREDVPIRPRDTFQRPTARLQDVMPDYLPSRPG